MARSVVRQRDEQFFTPPIHAGKVRSAQSNSGHEVRGVVDIDLTSLDPLLADASQNFREIRHVVKPELSSDVHNAVRGISQVGDGEALVPWNMRDIGSCTGDDDGALV